MVSSFQARNKSWKSAVNLCFIAMVIFAMDSPASTMDVLVNPKVNALNGTTIRLSCTFTSCYKIDINRFSMNWTYRETLNDTEEMLMMFKHRVSVIRNERFGDRVVFAGNLEKNDVSITISDVQLYDNGIYKCYVRNPPDRQLGQAEIWLNVLTELPPPRDSTIAVVVGASVGGILAVLILSMVVVKCVRRRRKQELISDEQKMEEEGKTEVEGGTEEGTKHAYSLPEDAY